MSNENPSVQIVIAAHKAYEMPQDSLYLPVHVGAALSDKQLGFQRDDEGDNISVRNPYFCELTGLYWAWKNVKTDYVGLAHYRRHFSVKKKGGKPLDSVLNSEQAQNLAKRYRVIVPKKRHYMIETLYSHYKHTHYEEHLIMTKNIIADQCPEYLGAYSEIMHRTSGYMFNMSIMERDLLDEYCSWLFNILFELENRLGNPELTMSSYQGRLYGRVSEIIFNVWLYHQIEIGHIAATDVKEVNCICTEKVNWFKKGGSFLKSKFFHKKYEGSF